MQKNKLFKVCKKNKLLRKKYAKKNKLLRKKYARKISF